MNAMLNRCCVHKLFRCCVFFEYDASEIYIHSVESVIYDHTWFVAMDRRGNTVTSGCLYDCGRRSYISGLGGVGGCVL